MTNEQWLMYVYSIYPDGSFLALWVLSFISWSIILGILWIAHLEASCEAATAFHRLGKYKIGITALLVTLILVSNLVPSKKYFLYILATPYVVESGESIVQQLEDKTSKLYKINKLLDAKLDSVLDELTIKESNEKSQIKESN